MCVLFGQWLVSMTKNNIIQKSFLTSMWKKKQAATPMLKISPYQLQFHFCPLASGLGFEAQKKYPLYFFKRHK
jgi:hypothetical protein